VLVGAADLRRYDFENDAVIDRLPAGLRKVGKSIF
jgi:hypothetical protein